MGSRGTLNLTAYAYSRSIGVILHLSAPVRIRYTDLLFSSLEDYGLLCMPGLPPLSCYGHNVVS